MIEFVDSVDIIALLCVAKISQFVNSLNTITLLLIQEGNLEIVNNIDTITLLQRE